jgi:hypothetical protein
MTTELTRTRSADVGTTDAWQASLPGADLLALGLASTAAAPHLFSPVGNPLSDLPLPFARPVAAKKAAKDDDDAEEADEDEDEDDDDEDEDDDFDDDVDEDDDEDDDDEDEDDDELGDDEDEDDDDFDDDDDDDDDEEEFAGEEE